MYSVRLWSVRHARGMNAFYRGFESALVRMSGLFRALGYERIERPTAAVEKAVKGLLFDCRMCGQCVLSSTGMSCPMNCPKTLRNGPCGGVRANGNCEVKPEMRCVWVEAYRGSERIPGGIAAMSQVQFAVDQRQQGRSSWLRVVREKQPPLPGPRRPRREVRGRTGTRLSAADLAGTYLPGRFERVLRAGGFAVTTELAPPDSADPEDVYKRARVFNGYVDAINATDGSGANCHMSSLAVCALLTRVGYAPIMQISCRDKNRIAIQGDILGGAAMGVCNMLCLTGDGVQAGDHPQAKPVFDLDCVSLLEIARTLRDEHHFQSGRKITLRAARVLRRRRKSLGTTPRLARPAPREKGRRRRAVHPDPILLRPAAAARLHGPGRGARPARQGLHPGGRRAAALGEDGRVDAQERPRHARAGRAIARLEGAKDQAREGRNICIELIQAMREIRGISGVHIMAYRQEETVAEIVDRSAYCRAALPGIPGATSPSSVSKDRIT